MDFDLALIGSNPEKILTQLERASRARQRYLIQAGERNVKADPAVDHQLLNHVQLLESLAQLAGVWASHTEEAIRRGAAIARDELA